jgi:O-antigen/teichoic acid export membrane protein
VLIYVLLAVCIFGYSAMFVKLWWLSRHGQMGTLAETEIRLGFAGLILFLLCLLLIAFMQAG